MITILVFVAGAVCLLGHITRIQMQTATERSVAVLSTLCGRTCDWNYRQRIAMTWPSMTRVFKGALLPQL